MNKFLTATIFLLFQMHGFAQNHFVHDYVQFFARGKALGFVIIEDRWVRTFSLGTEIKLYKRFSLVADVVHFRWRYEEEVHDLPDPEKYSEYSQYDARNYLAFELRYYPQFKRLSDDFMPYINLFSKFGKRNVRNEDKYPVKDKDVIHINGAFQDVGMSLGFEAGSRFGFDFNMGAVYRWENRDEQVFHLNEPLTYNKNVTQNRWMANIRVSFYWNFSY